MLAEAVQTVDKLRVCHPERSEAKSKDLKKFNIQLIHGILRHFVPQNDSALFVGRDFVYTLNDLCPLGQRPFAVFPVHLGFFKKKLAWNSPSSAAITSSPP